MANEFIARKGIIILANGMRVTGSVDVGTSVTASAFRGNGAQLTNIPYGQLTGVPTGIASSSAQVVSYVAGQQISPAGITSSLLGNASTATSASYALTASYALNVPTLVASASYALTSSAATSITFTPATASYAIVAQSVLGGVTNAVTASYVEYANVQNKPTLVSSSAQINSGSFTGSFVGSASYALQATNANAALTATSASYALSSSFAVQSLAANTATSASYALSASFALNANVAAVANSVEFANIANKPTLVSSSAQVNSGSFTGSFVGSASFASQALNANTALFATSASYAATDWNAINNKPTVFSSSVQVQYGQISGTPVGIVSSSAQTVALIAGQAIAPLSVNGVNILSLASTGSNTFTGTQTFQNITILGTSSIAYVTSSQVNVGNNRILLNSNDILRFAGFSVVDADTPSRSGSLYYDSTKNTWLGQYQGSATTPLSSSMFIMGPRQNGALGSEGGLTANVIPKASGYANGEFIQDSQITDDGTTVTIPNTLAVATAKFATSLYTTGSAAVDIGTFVIASIPVALYDGAVFTYVVKKSASQSVRTGQVLATWSGSVTEFTDTSTTDIGATTDVDFSVDILAGNVRLKATSLTNGWTVKTIIQAL